MSNVQVIYTQEQYETEQFFDKNTFGLFLAGPISRNKKVMDSYRNKFLEVFTEYVKDSPSKFLIFNPEMNPTNPTKGTPETYQLWEQIAMKYCTVVVFNLDFEKECNPGLSTRCEFGQFLNKNCHVVADVSDNFSYSTNFTHNWMTMAELQGLKKNTKMHHSTNNLDMSKKIVEICTRKYFTETKDVFGGLVVALEDCSDFELQKLIKNHEKEHTVGAIYYVFQKNKFEVYQVLTDNKYERLYEKDNTETFYKWNSTKPNAVPSAYTSIEGVHVLIVDKTNKLGLIIRDDSFGKPRYFIPGGAIEKCESIKNAVKREVMEEIGVELTQEELDTMVITSVHHVASTRRTHSTNDNNYKFKLVLKRDISPKPSNEVKAVMWEPLDEIIKNENHFSVVRHAAKSTSTLTLQTEKNKEDVWL